MYSVPLEIHVTSYFHLLPFVCNVSTLLPSLMNKIVPGSVKRINKKGSNFVLMENHAAFQKAVKVCKPFFDFLPVRGSRVHTV